MNARKPRSVSVVALPTKDGTDRNIVDRNMQRTQKCLSSFFCHQYFCRKCIIWAKPSVVNNFCWNASHPVKLKMWSRYRTERNRGGCSVGVTGAMGGMRFILPIHSYHSHNSQQISRWALAPVWAGTRFQPGLTPSGSCTARS